MKKTLLSLLCLLSIGSFAFADEKSYTIEFKDNGTSSDGSSKLSSPAVSDVIVTSSQSLVSSLSVTGSVYKGRTGLGLKFGTSSANGTITVNLAADAQVVPTRYEVYAANWTTSEGDMILNSANFSTTSLAEKTLGSFNISATGTNKITSIKVGTSKKRGFVQKVIVYYNDETGGGTEPDPDPDPTPSGNGDVLSPTTMAGTGPTDKATYTNFSYTAPSGAVYQGATHFSNGVINLTNSAGTGNYRAIFTTTSAGTVKSVTLTDMKSGSGKSRSMKIYGSHSAFNPATDPEEQGTELSSTSVTSDNSPQNTTYNFTEDYEYVAIAAVSGALNLQSATIEWNSTQETTIAAPTFTPAAGTYYEAQNVAIACATEGVTLTYSTDGTTYQAYTGPVTVDHSMTLYAKATLGSNERTAQAEYVIKTVEAYNSIAQMMTVAPTTAGQSSDTFTVNFDATVAYNFGNYTYLYDGTDYVLMYLANPGVAAGNTILKGWNAQLKNYNGLLELIPASAGFTKGADATIPEPTVVTDLAATLVAANQGKYVKVNDVNLAADTPANTAAFQGTADGITIEFFNRFALAAQAAGNYNVTGFISVNNTTVQIFPTAYEVSSTPVTKCATPIFNPNGGAVYAGTDVTISCSTPGASITYSINGGTSVTVASPATVTITTACTITAKASAEGLSDSNEATATFTVTTAPNYVFYAAEITGMGTDENYFIKLVNIDGSESHSGSSTEATSLLGMTFRGWGMKLVFNHNDAGNNFATCYGNNVRLYTGESFTLTPADGITITKVVFQTASESNAPATGTGLTANFGEVEGTGKGVANPITWTGEATHTTPLTLTAMAAVRCKTIDVYTTGTTGIENVDTDNAADTPAVYYNLQGQRVQNPQNGLFIRVQGKKATKVIL